jgi:hypothetical protein
MVVDSWFKEAMGLGFGESLFIPCNSKAEGKALQKQFIKQKQELQVIAPESYLIIIKLVLRTGRFYIHLEKGGVSPLTAFKKSDGKMSRVELIPQSTKERRRVLMERDGYSQEEIERIEADESNTEKDLASKEYTPDGMGTS